VLVVVLLFVGLCLVGWYQHSRNVAAQERWFEEQKRENQRWFDEQKSRQEQPWQP
jgi:hypothetical protein